MADETIKDGKETIVLGGEGFSKLLGGIQKMRILMMNY